MESGKTISEKKKLVNSIVGSPLVPEMENMDLNRETFELFEKKLYKDISEKDIIDFALNILYMRCQLGMSGKDVMKQMSDHSAMKACKKVSLKEVLMTLDVEELRDMNEEYKELYKRQ